MVVMSERARPSMGVVKRPERLALRSAESVETTSSSGSSSTSKRASSLS
jgi:hypothetical protein